MKTETVSTKPKSKRKPKLDPNQSNPDLLWKDLATEFIEEFILFFFGRRLFNAIDFSVKPEYLEQEFNEVFAANYPKKKIVDKIIKFQLKNGKMKFIILHTEFQGKAEKLFRVRMFEYFVHIFIKYKTSDVTALAIYTGPSRPQIYDRFHVAHYGTAVTYKFNTYTVRDQKEEALTVFFELLELNPNDNQGIRDQASLYCIELGKHDRFEKLQKEYNQDSTAFHYFNGALYTFIKNGDNSASRTELAKAREQNKHVLQLMLSKKELPILADHYGIGDKNEALFYCTVAKDVWHSIPGALAWLENVYNKR